MPKLIILSPSGEQTFSLEDSATIGRAPECAIVVDDAACSRRHCQILRISSGFELVDLKSRNGTKVNGVKRNRHVLSDGDVIEIGEYRITYREREGAEEEVVLEDFGGGASSAAESDCWLVWAEGEKKGTRIPLASGRVTFGRKDSNTVVLKDAMTSSYHCEITKESGGYILRDLGSTNGSVVNGEPVSEATLGHGARIRLGKTRFVFVDPAIADFEQALAAEEEAESEWGLVRAQVDMARVKRARRGTLLFGGLFVLLIGGGVAFFLLKPDAVKDLFGMSSTPPVREIAGNYVTDHSLEAQVNSFEAEEGIGVSVNRGQARQGDQSLLVNGTGAATGAALVTMTEAFDVVGEKPYEISAWIRPSPAGTLARAGVAWYEEGETSPSRTIFTPFAADGDWNEARVVAESPRGARRARFVLAVIGEGSAWFDDLVFRRVDEAGARTAVLSRSGIEIHAGGDGSLSIGKSGEPLLRNGGFAGETKDGAIVAAPWWTEGAPDGAAPADSGPPVSGRLRTPDGGEVPFRIALAPREAGYTVSVSGGEGLARRGLSFVVSRQFLGEGAVASGDGFATPVEIDVPIDGVTKVILGGARGRIGLTAPAGTRFVAFAADDGLRLAFLAPPGEGTAEFGILVDFTAERAEARRLLTEAQSLESGGRRGEAIALFTRVVAEFPFDEDLRNRAEEARTKLVENGRNRLAAAAARFDGAKDFHDRSDLEAARKDSAKLAEEFAGHEIGEQAAELTGRAAALLDEGERREREELAARLTLRAEDFEARGQLRLARLLYDRILSECPGTEAAERAGEKVSELSKAIAGR